MSDPADQTTVVPPASEPTGAPLRAERRKPEQPQSRSRQARVVVRKLGPWSVLKISFLFYLCVMAVIVGAMMILYGILGAIGALDSLTRLIRDLFADRASRSRGWLFSAASRSAWRWWCCGR